MRSNLLTSGDGVVIRAIAAGGPARATAPEWRFAYYAPGLRMPMHSHDVAQFSCLLAGSARETTRRGAFDPDPALMEAKPAGFAHANEFGPDGALLLSINLPQAEIDDADPLLLDEWRVRPATGVRREWAELAALMASETAELCDLEEVTVDLLAGLVGEDADLARSAPPRWLARARIAVRETDFSFQAIANDAGVHRVHLARAFRRHFNRSMTEERRQARIGAAVRRLIHDGADACSAGHDAGFADQSHFTRTLRRQAGLTPARLRALFAF